MKIWSRAIAQNMNETIRNILPKISIQDRVFLFIFWAMRRLLYIIFDDYFLKIANLPWAWSDFSRLGPGVRSFRFWTGSIFGNAWISWRLLFASIPSSPRLVLVMITIGLEIDLLLVQEGLFLQNNSKRFLFPFK